MTLPKNLCKNASERQKSTFTYLTIQEKKYFAQNLTTSYLNSCIVKLSIGTILSPRIVDLQNWQNGINNLDRCKVWKKHFLWSKLETKVISVLKPYVYFVLIDWRSRIVKIYSNSERLEQFLVTEFLFNLFLRFLRSKNRNN